MGISGIILTKLDGDARGGAALSIREMVGKPILFSGIGEKLDALEPFYPDRLASRILGMGDVLSLIDKVQQNVEQKEAERLQKAFQKQQFTLEEFQIQLQQIKRMGSMGSLLEMIPGGKKLASQVDAEKAEKELKRVEAIINSMTLQERRNPAILNGSRRRRIAQGSGTTRDRCQSIDEAVFGDEKNDAEGQQGGHAFASQPNAQPFPLTGEGRNSMSVSNSLEPTWGQEKAFLSHRRQRPTFSPRRPLHRAGRHLRSHAPRPADIKINQEKIDTWIKNGAQPTRTVSELIKKEQKAS